MAAISTANSTPLQAPAKPPRLGATEVTESEHAALLANQPVRRPNHDCPPMHECDEGADAVERVIDQG